MAHYESPRCRGIVREEDSGDDFIVGYLEVWNGMMLSLPKYEEVEHPYHRALDVICVDIANRQLREGGR